MLEVRLANNPAVAVRRAKVMQWRELLDTEGFHPASGQVIESGAPHRPQPDHDYVVTPRIRHYFTKLKRDAETIECRLRKYSESAYEFVHED